MCSLRCILRRCRHDPALFTAQVRANGYPRVQALPRTCTCLDLTWSAHWDDKDSLGETQGLQEFPHLTSVTLHKFRCMHAEHMLLLLLRPSETDRRPVLGRGPA